MYAKSGADVAARGHLHSLVPSSIDSISRMLLGPLPRGHSANVLLRASPTVRAARSSRSRSVILDPCACLRAHRARVHSGVGRVSAHFRGVHACWHARGRSSSGACVRVEATRVHAKRTDM